MYLASESELRHGAPAAWCTESLTLSGSFLAPMPVNPESEEDFQPQCNALRSLFAANRFFGGLALFRDGGSTGHQRVRSRCLCMSLPGMPSHRGSYLCVAKTGQVQATCTTALEPFQGWLIVCEEENKSEMTSGCMHHIGLLIRGQIWLAGYASVDTKHGRHLRGPPVPVPHVLPPGPLQGQPSARQQTRQQSRAAAYTPCRRCDNKGQTCLWLARHLGSFWIACAQKSCGSGSTKVGRYGQAA